MYQLMPDEVDDRLACCAINSMSDAGPSIDLALDIAARQIGNKNN